jgi:formiminotetrahydrofolate cyclodeaminase
VSDLKKKAKEQINDAAKAARRVAGHVADKTKDVAHEAGKKLEKGGKRLQGA